MDFARVEAEFRRLKAQFEKGSLAEADFKAQLEELMIEDEQGRWWVIGYKTGQWYVHDGDTWLQQDPPGATTRAMPARPSTADLPVVSQSKRAGPASWLSALDQKLGRETVSVLLITAAWLVCFAGFTALHYRYHSVFSAIAGGVGGLITGLVLRLTEPRSPWKLLPVVVVGWAVAMAIERSWPAVFQFSWMIRGAVLGLIGGLITALALKWAHPSIQWKKIALVTLGWGIGWAIGGAVAYSLLRAGHPSSYFIFLDAVWGGIGGAIGSWVMFRQLCQATETRPLG